jgi:hypothetical protein
VDYFGVLARVERSKHGCTVYVPESERAKVESLQEMLSQSPVLDIYEYDSKLSAEFRRIWKTEGRDYLRQAITERGVDVTEKTDQEIDKLWRQGNLYASWDFAEKGGRVVLNYKEIADLAAEFLRIGRWPE